MRESWVSREREGREGEKGEGEREREVGRTM